MWGFVDFVCLTGLWIKYLCVFGGLVLCLYFFHLASTFFFYSWHYNVLLWFITATYMMWSINECNWCILSCYQFIKQSPHSLNTYVAFGLWCSTAVCLFSMKRRNESFWHFGKYDCLLSCQQLDKKVYTTLMSVKW